MGLQPAREQTERFIAPLCAPFSFCSRLADFPRSAPIAGGPINRS